MIKFYINNLIKIEITELGLIVFILLFCMINYQMEICYMFNKVKNWIKSKIV